jgi:alkylation response protein AidB-like acyl-CoA dehydrogenase
MIASEQSRQSRKEDRMDFTFTQEEETFRQEVRSFIEAELPPDYVYEFMMVGLETDKMDFTRSMAKKLAEKGWLTMAWPKEYGGQGRSPMEQVVYWEECSYYGVPGIDMGVGGIAWIGPSLMLFGTEEQKQEHLPKLAQGERFWCTGFSEPGAGSDLASLQCRAKLDGDHYIVNGQKIWTSGAHVADWIWLAVRTNPDAPKKNQGISVLMVDMKTPGITVNKLIEETGTEGLNEVFFDDVRVPKENVVGGENMGWMVVMAGLALERGNPGVMTATSIRRLLDDLQGYVKDTQVEGRPLAKDPFVRSSLANMAIETELAQILAYRAVEVAFRPGAPEGEVARLSSTSKIFNAELFQRSFQMGLQIMGLPGQLTTDSRWAPLQGRIARGLLFSPAYSLLSGTSEILRSVIGTMGYGLPRR